MSKNLFDAQKASPKINMYPLSRKQWNVGAGCLHGCVYCESSFQRQLKRWAKGNCQQCYDFVPHLHPERLTESLPKTKGREFIFVNANGDWAFMHPDWREMILTRIRGEPDKTFLIQSKNPLCFENTEFPSNVLLGTTIETNRMELYEGFSHAIDLTSRYLVLWRLKHKRKMLTFEPIMDFDLDVLLRWVANIKPEMVWVGYDSKRNYLPEPELEKTRLFVEKLRESGFFVVEKLMRKAWWEQP